MEPRSSGQSSDEDASVASTTLEQVLHRHELSRRDTAESVAGVADASVAATRPGTARRMASIERLAAEELASREDELRETVETVRSGFECALSDLRSWWSHREEERARQERAAVAALTQEDQPGLESSIVVPRLPLADPVASEELEQALGRARSIEAMMFDSAGSPAGRVETGVQPESSGAASSLGCVLTTDLEVLTEVPKGLEGFGAQDRELQRELKRQLMDKYGLVGSDKGTGAGGVCVSDLSRDMARLKVELAMQGAGMDRVLFDLGL